MSMLDRIVVSAHINLDDTQAIAERNALQQWSNGTSTRYESSKIAQTQGIQISIEKNKLQIKCSVHKQYYLIEYGVLDNSGLFTISQARKSLLFLLEQIGLSPDKVKITYYEIGLNLPTSHSPLEYIELMRTIGAGKSKEVFNDANYKKHRQITTERHRNLKKIFKVYDKGFEQTERKREQPNEAIKILRIETIYKRQNIAVLKFMEQSNLDKLTSKFRQDWQSVEFERVMLADKGTRQSQVAQAQLIITQGREQYTANIKKRFALGEITTAQFRTMKAFADTWESNKHKYRELATPHEAEYKRLIKLYAELAMV